MGRGKERLIASSRKLTDDELIEKYVEPDPNTPDRAKWRLIESENGVAVWALMAWLLPDRSNAEQVARDFKVSIDSLAAAEAYYRRNKQYIDAWNLLNWPE